MVKNRLKILLILIAISFFSISLVNNCTAKSDNKTKIVIIKKGKFTDIKHRNNRYILPTVILGILTFALTFFVFFVRYKVAKEIKRRQKNRYIGAKHER